MEEIRVEPPRRAAILIMPTFSNLTLAAVMEPLRAANRMAGRRLFDWTVVTDRGEPIPSSSGLKVTPDVSLAACPPLDVLVVPGGWGTRREIGNPVLREWIAERGRQVETLTSVCTGAMLLGHTGLLDGRHATTHWRSLDWMSESFPRVTVERELHVVEDGNVLTSAGISAGIDMSLRVVARYHGEAIGRATARHMEYPYPEDNRRRI